MRDFKCAMGSKREQLISSRGTEEEGFWGAQVSSETFAAEAF